MERTPSGQSVRAAILFREPTLPARVEGPKLGWGGGKLIGIPWREGRAFFGFFLLGTRLEQGGMYSCTLHRRAEAQCGRAKREKVVGFQRWAWERSFFPFPCRILIFSFGHDSRRGLLKSVLLCRATREELMCLAFSYAWEVPGTMKRKMTTGGGERGQNGRMLLSMRWLCVAAAGCVRIGYDRLFLYHCDFHCRDVVRVRQSFFRGTCKLDTHDEIRSGR